MDDFKKIKPPAWWRTAPMRRFNLHVGSANSTPGTLYPFNVTLNIVGTIPRAPAPKTS